MSFGAPTILWLLLVLPPALIAFYWWSWRQRKVLLTRFIQSRLLPGLVSGLSPARQRIRAACVVLAAALLIVALARPQWGFHWEEVKQKGLDIVVAIDTSKSMLAEDISPNRLARAKLAALELMQKARSDRLGLVAFAGTAYLQCPLTIDDAAFRQSVEYLDVSIIPQGGTAIAEAINTALTAFKEGENFKVLVLFTDGEDHDSGAVEAARKAATAGLQIFTVGIGSEEGEVLRVRDKTGRTDFIKDEQGNAVKSRLNTALLQEIAGEAKGFYLPLHGATTIDTLYANGLAPLPKTEGKERLVKQYQERFHWPLGLAILLLAAEMLIPERKAAKRSVARPKTAAAAVAVIAWLLWPQPLTASPGSALRNYRSGEYDRALKEFETLQKKKDDPRLHYNAGASAYKKGDFDEAAKQFQDALSSPDLKLQESAYYNLGNTLFYQGHGAMDPAEKTKKWEQSVKNFESSLKLNPADADAKFNHDFVKQRLEELKQQQQQQQSSKDQKQDQKDQQKQDPQQQQQSQQNQDQQKDQHQQQNAEQQKQDQQQQQQAQQQQQEQNKGEKSEQEQQQAQQQPPKPDQQKEEQQAAPAEKKDQQEKDQEQQQAALPGQMTPEQARRLLDAQKGDEQMLPPDTKQKPQDVSRPFKDW